MDSWLRNSIDRNKEKKLFYKFQSMKFCLIYIYILFVIFLKKFLSISCVFKEYMLLIKINVGSRVSNHAYSARGNTTLMVFTQCIDLYKTVFKKC